MNKEPSIKEFRHKAEMPLLILGYVLTVLVAVGALIVVVSGGELKPWASGVLIGLLSPFLALFMLKYMYYKKVSNSVQLTEKQFPELYNLYKEAALNMGFTEEEGKNQIPPLYLSNGDGVLNAFAAKCALHEKYVVVNSDIADIAYVHGNFNALKFVLCHELAHIKCGHVNLKRLIVAPVLKVLFLSKSLTRAQEYTADRVACYYAPNGTMGLVYLYAGKNLGGYVNIDEYFRTVENNDKHLFLKFINFRSDHAVGYRRMKALYDTKEKGWDVHGQML
ncbi:MAG: peptidase M48 [Chloroflexi bacterium]|nr:MAG: peptidase M48 [Chloroflexota bacterium]